MSEPCAGPGSASAGLRVLGLRKDRTRFPAEVSLRPAPAGAGRFAVVVTGDVSALEQRRGLAAAAAAPAGEQAACELAGMVVGRLFAAGMRLQAAADVSAGPARQLIAEAAEQLDDAVREIRDAAFAGPARQP